jgi:catechol 2,3-dioxygenase-like lactoylglutathione lyase family enzyme
MAGTSFKIDHIVIMVDDLAAAMEDYRALGFTVLAGGKHEANPTHNALVVFEDGVYLELIALQPGSTSPRSPRLQRWLAAGPGLVDMALLPADIEADIAAARQRGVVIEDAEPGGRLRPDGQQIAWKTANLKGAGLPFFCADVTPRSLRAPEGGARQHSNGAAGVANVTIAVTNLEASAGQYRALLGLEPHQDTAIALPEAQITTFGLEETTISLAQPSSKTSPLQAYLEAGGERPYSFTLRARQQADNLRLDLNRTHGVRIKFDFGSDARP